MSPVFADASYYVGLLSKLDEFHDLAARLTLTLDRPIVTTDWIMLELAAFFSKPPLRSRLCNFVSLLQQDSRTKIISVDPQLRDRAWMLYQARHD